MSDDQNKENESTNTKKKVLTPKELLEKRNQHLAKVKSNRGPAHNADLHAKKPSHNSSGHTHRTHKPQGG